MPFQVSQQRRPKHAQKVQKFKPNEEVKEVQPSTALPKTSNTKSLQEMKVFIAQMQQKYNPSGNLTATATEDGQTLKTNINMLTDKYSQKLLHKDFSYINSHSDELNKYLDVSECVKKGTAVVSPTTGVEEEQQQHKAEKQHVDLSEDPPTRYIVSHSCTCSYAEVAEEAASLRILVLEMQRQHNELRRGTL